MDAESTCTFATRPHGASATRGVHLILACLMCAALFLLSPRTALAAGHFSPFEQGSNYSAVLYDNRNGLPTSEANDIAQTEDGFIWLGCYSGLIRYDGNSFELMNTSTGIDSVDALFVDSKDRLWIGTNDNGLAMMDNWEIVRWDEEDGLPSPKVEAIAEGADGTIYVGTTAGVVMITSNLEVLAPSDHRVATAYVDRISLASDGLVYCMTNEGDYFTLRNGTLVRYVNHAATSIEGISCIFPDPVEPGSVYVGTAYSTLYRGNPKNGTDSFETIDISPLSEVMDMELIDGRLWIGARNGLGVLDEQGFHLANDLPLNSSVTCVMEDYEGNLWFASTRQGAMKVVPNQFIDIFAEYGIPYTTTNTTCIHNGMFLIGTDSGMYAINQATKEPISTIPLNSARTASGEDLGATNLLELTDGCRIRSILRDSQGRLWISTWRSAGLLCYFGGDVVVYTEKDGLPSMHIRAVSETPDGSILVACTGGGVLIKDDQIVRTFTKDDGIQNLETLCACAAPNGDLLLGSNGGGIYVFNDHGMRTITRADGLDSDIVMRIKYDAGHNLFWLITSSAVAYMTPDYQVTTVTTFPYSNNFDLYENNRDEMIVLSSFGIFVVPVEELIENNVSEPVRYGIANGLPCTPTSNSYSELAADGTLYFAGNKGVVKVDIDTSLETSADLKQAVPFIDVDGERCYTTSGVFTIPSRARRVTIYPFVFNYSLSDPQVSYHLQGFDESPISVPRSDLGPVTYTNLRGGSYAFVMTIEGSRGDTSTITVPIKKEMAFYEYWWFYLLGLILVGSIAYVAAHLHTKRKMRALEEKHRAEAERERIAHELQVAAQIQGSMLPHDFPPFPDRTEFDIYALMDPAREVGGDFYDFYLVDEDHLCIVMADVSGKGIPAALFMMTSKGTLQRFASLGMSADEILTKANESLYANNQVDMFVTVWLGILELSTGKLVAANAGHEYPAIKRAGGSWELLRDRHGFVIGGMDGVRYKKYELQLSPGDRIFLYTDGVPEATNAQNEMFGNDRMIEALNETPDASPYELLNHLHASVDAFVKDAMQFDDLTMLCLDYKGPAAS